MSDNLKGKMIRALAWSSVDRFGQQAVQFIIGIILARLLSPSDYGLIGLLMIFSALSSVLVDGGFGQALIRKKDADQTDYSSIFFLNLGVSVFIYGVLFFSAPAISIFFNQPQLTLISRVLFLSVIFYALYFVQYVQIVKEVDYKSLAKVNIISTFLSGGIGIYMAFEGYGVWALVTQQISYHIFRLILFYIIRQWRPHLIFSFNVIKSFWHFSIHLLGTSTLNVVFNNVYMVLIGRFYPIRQVGFYTQSNKLNETINYSFQQILQGGTYPLLVQIQNEEERYRRVYRKMTHMVSIFLFPLIFTLIAVSEPLINTLLSNKWAESIPLFQLLCLANVFTPFFGLNISVLNSRGESKKTLQLELIKKGLIIISILLCFAYGIISMLIGFVIASFISYVVSMAFIKKNLKYLFKQQLSDICPSLFVATFVSSFIFLLKKMPFIENNFFILLIIQSIVAFIIYIILLFIFKKELFNKIKRILMFQKKG